MTGRPSSTWRSAHGERVRLSDFRGRSNVLLVFHPFAFTPVCEDEARDLQENLESFRDAETEIVFVSCDPSAARQAWKEQLGAEYTFASDFWPHGEAAKAYGVFNEANGAPHRGTFLIDSDGHRHLVAREGARRAPDGDGARLARGARRNRRDARTRRVGRPGDRPRVVCLHGVRNHGEHFAPLADGARRATTCSRPICSATATRRGAAVGHRTHCDAIVETVGAREPSLVGHSFGGRLAFELAARAPKLVPKLVLLDPAILASRRTSRCSRPRTRAPSRSYVSFDELIERRYDESQLHRRRASSSSRSSPRHVERDDDGRCRYRYCQSAVVAAYGEMASQPPRFEDVRVPTLLVLGERSYLPYDHLLDAHSAALGDLLEVVVVPGGHTVLWDAFEETAAAIAEFLAR